ncbi:hydroxymethylglutaryl-CoA synthase [Nocardia arthritidis]|uniref:Hydroxymethylglutaryl-CoA synthase n=1 Tax=Nocardia arthritidis TaxID=228602 RepID=A0A6G9Y6V2_9NOCA|nr:hydroxymethylglutaryl-CoA synthase [Nocardia arthritidis]QIS08783.1 hydroxymethylglutaryl-CoA synthase [Nocardia arthritidis]
MNETPSVGIHDMSFATTHYVLDLDELARHHNVNPAKYHVGLGQDAMSVPAPDEDIVTMAATAAAPILQRHGTDHLRTVLIATETGIDQAKAAALYLHPLLGLPSTTRVVELKQACYAGTAAVQMAAGLIARDPNQQVLVIASDIAHYQLDTPAEATQGAGAVALLVSADPAIARLDPVCGLYSADVMDFWRPNYRTTPIVDGHYSITSYLAAAAQAWRDYSGRGGRDLSEFASFCYHQPFTTMAFKAHHHLMCSAGITPDPTAIHAALRYTTDYNRVIGNSYTASLYLALTSLLDHAGDLTDAPIGLLSYGSGAVAEFFSVTVVPGYREHLRTTATSQAISSRKPIDYDDYRALHDTHLPTDGGRHVLDEHTTGGFRLAGVTNHIRVYETC